MATALLRAGGIALVGAPDSDMDSRDANSPPMQAMQVEMTQEIIDELLESVRSGKAPQIFFGKNPQLKYGDKTHVIHSSPESHRCELYRSSGAGDDAEFEFEFAGMINHSLSVQKAEDVTAGVDSALQQLRSSMAAISEIKEANKTIVGDTTSSRTPGHRRFPSTGFKAQHLAPSKLGSPMLGTASSPMHKRAPTSQPSSSHDAVLNALRVPVIHLLARQPATEASLAETCRTSQSTMRELLSKIAKRSSPDTDKWQLTDKVFRELNPYKFPYQSAQDREQAIDSAIKAFDRQRLAKDDKLWQILLPREERGQGICLSRSKVKALEAKPKAKASTPMHKISDLTRKKPAAKKADEKPAEKKVRVVKEPEPKLKAAGKERPSVKDVKYEPKKAPTSSTNTPSSARPTAPSDRYTPSTDPSKSRPKKAPATQGNNSPRVKSNMSGRDQHRDRIVRPVKPVIPINTKPKNPSPLSASPPVNASDFEDSHPVHKALAAAVSPAKATNSNSDRSLKRKANDIDSDIHNHNLAVKKPHLDRAAPNHTPSHTNGRLNGSTPSSGNSLKRKSDDSSSSNTPSTAPKVRKVNNIDTGAASRYHNNNSQASPGASSSSTTSPTIPNLSFRQTVELSQRFQKYYKKYEELYWQLTESDKSPTEAQRNDLLRMHKKLEEMKREIKAGAGVHR
ncbi:E3 ubiquitin protein ligase [Parastagonospora nodorum]|nr:E3 ubiquitin protein ligase [Parastagonospora nodorum]KAH4672629.1 E3 ubiquitin protein ligase [Parastagonospora nodorum]KAH4697091.1 E3 ubiquitin protein ligase [Parastagonospora nodorum]KAH4765316.1 E3 ubiquitin protein ligase [Parastagonospora nodorum]KAH4774029.1 E3 ubiquitin protein ligase [Parastagonospora nodorum]